MRKKSIAYDKAKKFAIRIIELKKWLCEEHREYSIADQILRSGTSIGANIAESFDAVSLNDFSNKLSIALKECSETKYWLEIMFESRLLDEERYNSFYADCNELYLILSSSVKTLSEKKNQASQLSTHDSRLSIKKEL